MIGGCGQATLYCTRMSLGWDGYMDGKLEGESGEI